MQTNTVPEQVHLAYDTNPNTITVAWVTLIKTDSTVQYGLSATALDQTATGTTQVCYLYFQMFENMCLYVFCG